MSSSSRRRERARVARADPSGLLPLVAAYAASTVVTDAVITGHVTYENTTTELGLLARGNIAEGHGYVLSLDPTNSYLNLIKLAPAMLGGFVDLAHCPLAGLTIRQGDTFKLEFTVDGDLLTGNLYSSAGRLLGTVQAPDSAYGSGTLGPKL